MFVIIRCHSGGNKVPDPYAYPEYGKQLLNLIWTQQAEQETNNKAEKLKPSSFCFLRHDEMIPPLEILQLLCVLS